MEEDQPKELPAVPSTPPPEEPPPTGKRDEPLPQIRYKKNGEIDRRCKGYKKVYRARSNAIDLTAEEMEKVPQLELPPPVRAADPVDQITDKVKELTVVEPPPAPAPKKGRGKRKESTPEGEPTPPKVKTPKVKVLKTPPQRKIKDVPPTPPRKKKLRESLTPDEEALRKTKLKKIVQRHKELQIGDTSDEEVESAVAPIIPEEKEDEEEEEIEESDTDLSDSSESSFEYEEVVIRKKPPVVKKKATPSKSESIPIPQPVVQSTTENKVLKDYSTKLFAENQRLKQVLNYNNHLSTISNASRKIAVSF